MKQSFYIEHTPNCKSNQKNYEENEKADEDWHKECSAQKYLIPGHSSIEYSCFHFHPSILTNHTEAYLLIKNNLTYIYPLKLEGSSGKGILKIQEVTTPYFSPNNENLTIKSSPIGNKDGIDLFFNLDMKHNLFKAAITN